MVEIKKKSVYFEKDGKNYEAKIVNGHCQVWQLYQGNIKILVSGLHLLTDEERKELING